MVHPIYRQKPMFMLIMIIGLIVVEISTVDQNGDRRTGARIMIRFNYTIG